MKREMEHELQLVVTVSISLLEEQEMVLLPICLPVENFLDILPPLQ